MRTSDVVATVVGVLAPYIGETMARSATEVHCRKLGVTTETLSPEQLDDLLHRLGSGLGVFVGRDRAQSVMKDLRAAIAGASA